MPPQRTEGDFPALRGDLARVHERVLGALSTGNPQTDEALSHLARHPGRYFRPALTAISVYLVAGDGPVPDRAVTAAAAVETLHLATLHHDDLCDKAVERRGIPTANARYGDDVALVLGDFLLSTALGHAASLGARESGAMARCARRICLGQLEELRDTGRLDRSVAQYLSTISGKTAELFRLSALLGATVGGADSIKSAALASFGHELGLAFQIWNDVRDLRAPATGPEGVPGRDLDNGVYTLPVLYGLRATGSELLPLLEGGDGGAGNAAQVVRLLESSGAVASAVATADGHLHKALRELDALGAADSGRKLLRTIRVLLPETAELAGTAPWPPAPRGERTREAGA